MSGLMEEKSSKSSKIFRFEIEQIDGVVKAVIKLDDAENSKEFNDMCLGLLNASKIVKVFKLN